MNDSSSLANRYNTAPKRRVPYKAIGISALVIAIGLVFWFTYSANVDRLDYKDVGYSTAEEGYTSVRFQLSRDEDRDVMCAVAALSDSYATVGYKTVLVPAGEENGFFNVDLRIDSPATTGVVDECWYHTDETLPPYTAERVNIGN